MLDVCIEAFGETGFNGTTMRDIANRAGISQTGLMHHFPNKGDLLIEVLKARDAQMARLADQGGREGFLEAQLRVVEDNEHRPGLVQLHTLIAAEATNDDHPAHDLYRQRYDDLRLYLEVVFDELRAEGRVLVDSESRDLANAFVGVLDGLQLQWAYNREAVDVAAGLRSYLRAVVRPRG